jgi:hypothetical protein
VQNATFNISADSAALVYFEGTRPDPNRTTTDAEATIAAANVAPQILRLVPVAFVGGEPQSLGSWLVQSIGDSVTLYSSEGMYHGD